MRTIAICVCILLLPAFTFALDINDDGRAWSKSNQTEKMKVAEQIGFQFKTPATFWLETFESYYNTDKPEKLNKSIIDVAFEQTKSEREQPAEAYEEPTKGGFQQSKPETEQPAEASKQPRICTLEIFHDGYAWRKSNKIDKMSVAEEIGFRFKTPATFWLEIFESYYNTDKPERLIKPIIDVAFEQSKSEPEQPAEAYEEPKKGD
jgi:hypothetical protein